MGKTKLTLTHILKGRCSHLICTLDSRGGSRGTSNTSG